MEFVRKASFEDYMAARRRRFEYVRELDLLLGDDAVLLTPTNCVAWIRADGTNPETGEVGDSPDAFNTDPQNMTGHPAISVPAGSPRTVCRSAWRSPRRGSRTAWHSRRRKPGSARTRGRFVAPGYELFGA